MSQQIDPLVERLGLSMWKVQRKIASQMSLHREIGLTVPQFGLLRMIAQEQNARVIQLADKMEVKSSAVTVMLDRLELLGLSAREQDEHDRRAVIVTLTDKGRSCLKKGKTASCFCLVNIWPSCNRKSCKISLTIIRCWTSRNVND